MATQVRSPPKFAVSLASALNSPEAASSRVSAHPQLGLIRIPSLAYTTGRTGLYTFAEPSISSKIICSSKRLLAHPQRSEPHGRWYRHPPLSTFSPILRNADSRVSSTATVRSLSGVKYKPPVFLANLRSAIVAVSSLGSIASGHLRRSHRVPEGRRGMNVSLTFLTKSVSELLHHQQL